MRHSRLFGRRGPCRDNGEIAIDLHGIGIDDDAAERFGERERERRLPARGRAGDEDGGRGGHGIELDRGRRRNQHGSPVQCLGV